MRRVAEFSETACRGVGMGALGDVLFYGFFAIVPTLGGILILIHAERVTTWLKDVWYGTPLDRMNRNSRTVTSTRLMAVVFLFMGMCIGVPGLIVSLTRL
jgi:hypothetical protein